MRPMPVMEPSDYHCPFCHAAPMVLNKRVRVPHLADCPRRLYLAKLGIIPHRYQRIRFDTVERQLINV